MYNIDILINNVNFTIMGTFDEVPREFLKLKCTIRTYIVKHEDKITEL